MVKRWEVKEISFNADVSDTWHGNKVFLILDTKKKHFMTGLRFTDKVKAQTTCDNMNSKEKGVDRMFQKEFGKMDIPHYDRSSMSIHDIMKMDNPRGRN